MLALSRGLALTRLIKKWAAAGALGVATFYLAVSGAERRDPALLHHARRDPLAAVLLDRRAIRAHGTLPSAAILVLLIELESLLTAELPDVVRRDRWRWSPATRPCGDRAARNVALAGAGRPWPGGAHGRAAYGLFLTSLIAAVATTPFAIYHFQRAAPLSLLANLAAMPVVGVLVRACRAVLGRPDALRPGVLALVPMGWGIDWMVSRGDDGGWSEGWGGVPAVPASALLLVVAGFLWLALWRERWRLAGLVPILLAIPLALSAPRPDILIDADGRAVAVRGADGRYSIVNPKADRFAVEYWLRADADPRTVDDGVSASNT